MPLPRSHFHEEGLPLDESANCTTSGAHPAFGEALKLAVNCALAIKPAKKKKVNKATYLRAFDTINKKFRVFKDRKLDIKKQIHKYTIILIKREPVNFIAIRNTKNRIDNLQRANYLKTNFLTKKKLLPCHVKYDGARTSPRSQF